MTAESEEDDTGLLEDLQEWVYLAGSLRTPEEVAGEFALSLRAIDHLVKLCVKVDEQGQSLGMVSAVRTTTVLRVLAAELTGREVTLEMPGVISYRPDEVNPL